MHFRVRYDLRNPPQWRQPFDRFYAGFLDQVAWLDAHGFDRVSLSEHHFVEDGYLPSPFTMAAAIAARTKRIRIHLSIVVLPLKHPVQVAEDAAVVDILSGGRLDMAVAGGYRANEFEGYGIPREERPGRLEEEVEIIKKCWEEEEFSFSGRYWDLKNVRVVPKPVQKPRPRIVMGGSSAAAARRAARIADGFQPSHPRWFKEYQEECTRLGKDPGPLPPADAPRAPFFLHVSRNPDAAWKKIAPHALYETNEYARYSRDDPTLAFKPTSDADTLRQSGRYVVWTPEETVAFGKRVEQALGPAAGLSFHPLSGGLPFDLAQESLELVVKDVMPHFRKPGA